MPRFSPLNLLLIGAIGLALLLLTLRHDPGAGIEVERRDAPGRLDEIVVHLSGAVRTPGAYTVQPGDRVVDAIDLAGGLTKDADNAGVNLALRLSDEVHIHVPTIGEGKPLLDLNVATAAQLDELPGIGPVYAGHIVEERARRSFVSSDELVERDVLPEHVYEKIRTLVTVGSP